MLQIVTVTIIILFQKQNHCYLQNKKQKIINSIHYNAMDDKKIKNTTKQK